MPKFRIWPCSTRQHVTIQLPNLGKNSASFVGMRLLRFALAADINFAVTVLY